MPFIKTLTIDDFYTKEQADTLTAAVYYLGTGENDFGSDIENFNHVPENPNELFSSVLRMNVEVNEERSGVFRHPKMFVHFEDFADSSEWIFAVALQDSTFNLFEHKTGSRSALEGFKYNYRNLFEWDLTVSYLLRPGQGILFRPWLFHSFDTGLIQMFRLNEKL